MSNKKSFRCSGKTFFAAILVALVSACNTMQMAGGGSDTEVSGRIIARSGAGAAGTIVAIIDTSFDAATDAGLAENRFDTADGQGGYHFNNLQAGVYNIWARDPVDSTQILINDVMVIAEKKIRLDDRMLKPAATVRFPLPDSLFVQPGPISVPGTILWTFTDGTGKTAGFTGVPQGVLSTIRFRKIQSDHPVNLFTHVVIDSAGLFVLDPYVAWQHAARVTLITSASGTALADTLFGFPLLVRLTAASIDFSQAKKEGEDLRFVRDDNVAIPFEIEDWDSVKSTAAVWVRVDTVPGNSTVTVGRMLWGNPSGKKASRPATVFDTAGGFRGVWHLDESGLNAKLDATANAFSGTPVAMTGSSDVAGVIARAHDFNGSSNCVTVLNARQSTLDVQADSSYTVSAWVYARNIQPDNRVMVSKGSAQYGLMMNEQNQWEFYAGLRGYGVDTTTVSPAAINVWTYLTGVRRGMKQYLYVDGVLADSTAFAGSVSATLSNNFYDFVIGRQSDEELQWFNGLIDEVRVENRARSPSWIRLCAENQKVGQIVVHTQKLR
jgi:hypothetical protein